MQPFLYVGSPSARHGKNYKHKDLEFYACEGLIVIEDNRDGTRVIERPDDIKDRVDQIAAAIRGLRSSANLSQRLFYRDNAPLVEQMYECIKEARFMGDPGDPKVIEFYLKHRPGSKSTVTGPRRQHSAVPAARDLYPELAPLSLGHFTGRTLDVPREPSSGIQMVVGATPVKKQRQQPVPAS